MEAVAKLKARRSRRPRGRPRAGGAVQRDEVLQTALEVFAERGYEGTSVLQLTRQLGVSHNLLHARFGSKRDLWEAAVDRCLERVRDRASEAGHGLGADASATERFRAVTAAFLVALAENPALLKLMNYEGARSSERLDHIAERFIVSGFADFRASLEDGIEAGEFRRGISPSALFLLLCHGGGAYLCLRPLGALLGVRTRRGPDTLRTQAEEITDLVLRAIQARAEPTGATS